MLLRVYYVLLNVKDLSYTFICSFYLCENLLYDYDVIFHN